LSAIYRSGIPGSGIARSMAIESNLKNKGIDELRQTAKELGIATSVATYGGSAMAGFFGKTGQRDITSQIELVRKLTDEIGKLDIKQQLKYADFDPGSVISSSIEESRAKIVESIKNLGTGALEALQKFENDLAGITGDMPVDISNQLKASYEKYVESGREDIAELQKKLEVLETTLPGDGSVTGTAGLTGGDIDKDAERTAAYQRTQIVAQMYRDMGQYGVEYYAAQKRLLDMQLEDWAKLGIDKELLADYASVAQKKRLIEAHEGLQVIQNALHQAEGDLSNFFYSMQRDFDSMSDHFKAFGRSLVDTFQKAVSDMIAKWVLFQITTNLFGSSWASALGFSNPLGGVGGGAPGVTQIGTPTTGLTTPAYIAHTGWNVGMEAGTSRMVSSALFANAPRLHDGLSDDEYPAILQRGERVKRRGSSDNFNIKVNVINKTSKNVRGQESGKVRFDGDAFVTDIILKDLETNGPINQRLDRR